MPSYYIIFPHFASLWGMDHPFFYNFFFKDTVTSYNLFTPEGPVCLQVRYLENIIGLSVTFLSHWKKWFCFPPETEVCFPINWVSLLSLLSHHSFRFTSQAGTSGLWDWKQQQQHKINGLSLVVRAVWANNLHFFFSCMVNWKVSRNLHFFGFQDNCFYLPKCAG